MDRNHTVRELLLQYYPRTDLELIYSTDSVHVPDATSANPTRAVSTGTDYEPVSCDTQRTCSINTSSSYCDTLYASKCTKVPYACTSGVHADAHSFACTSSCRIFRSTSTPTTRTCDSTCPTVYVHAWGSDEYACALACGSDVYEPASTRSAICYARHSSGTNSGNKCGCDAWSSTSTAASRRDSTTTLVTAVSASSIHTFCAASTSTTTLYHP